MTKKNNTENKMMKIQLSDNVNIQVGTAYQIHSALAFLGIPHDAIKFMGAESISCCEITINGRKHRGATWVAALEAVAANG